MPHSIKNKQISNKNRQKSSDEGSRASRKNDIMKRWQNEADEKFMDGLNGMKYGF